MSALPETQAAWEGPAETRPAAQPSRMGADWRPLLRALAEELDSIGGAEGRDLLLQGVGRQLAAQHPITPQQSTVGLALEMNEVLGHFGWGRVRMHFSAADACLYLTHEDLPRIGGRGDPPGTWLAAVMAGLYEGWLARQPGADPGFTARRVPAVEDGTVLIRYGRG
ncbi:cellulose biosynthesis protein BcsD [Acidisoma sp. 7E03]